MCLETIQVKTVTVEQNTGTSTLTFIYDNQNRLIKIDFGNSYTDIIQYSKNEITLFRHRKSWVGSTDTTYTYLFQLDNNGYLISDNYIGLYKYNDDNIAKNSYAYENGYLNEIKENITSNFGNDINNYYEFSWANGNIVQAMKKNSEDTSTAIYEYNSRENLLNIEVFSKFISVPYQKFKGCASKNYLVKETFAKGIYTYDYEFDKDGYPTQIISNYWSDGYLESTVKFILTYY